MEDMEKLAALKDVVNIDNQNILLHRQELFGYLRSGITRPITVEVDLTLCCNHCCPECTFAKHHGKRASLSEAVMNKIINNLKVLGVKGMIITGGGEPSIHKELGSFVRKVSKVGVDVTLTTNGQFIHRHFEDLMLNLRRIRFSIDAASKGTFKCTHGVTEKDFKQVIDNLKSAVKCKKDRKLPIDIGVSFLITKENAHEMEAAIDFYKGIGVDFLHFKPMQLWDNRKGRYSYSRYPQADLIYARIKDYANKDFRISISRENYYTENRLGIGYSKCHGAHFDMIIGADANVYTCCHLKYNPKYSYGNLHNENPADVLKKIKSGITDDCFINCKMDSLNQFIEFAKSHEDTVSKICKNIKPHKLPLGSKWL